MKKSVSLLLCMVLVFAMLPVTVVHGVAYYKEGIYTYTVSGGQATITDCNTSASGAITIPSTLGGYPVTTIGEYAFYRCDSLTNITIPNSVTTIGYSAFGDCDRLTSITIPNSVTSIGERAFFDCDSLTSITIPNSVTSIGEYAFYSCNSLTNITIPNSVTSIGEYAFYYCSSLTSITIPNSVTSIGDYAFDACYSLTSITIPNSVTTIGAFAFSRCNSLTDVYYTGSKSQWEQISIGDYNSGLKNATIHFAITGTQGSTNSTSDDAPIITSATITHDGSNYDLFSKAITIAKDSNVEVSIKAEVDFNGNENVKLYLTQGRGKVKELTVNGTTKVQPGKIFDASDTIYLLATDSKTGKSTAKKTKLKISSFADGDLFPDEKNLSFKLGKKFSFTIPDGVPIFENKEFGFDMDFIPVTFEYEHDNKINIAFGISDSNIDKTTGRFKGFSFADWKAEIKESSKKSLQEYQGAKHNKTINQRMKAKYPNFKAEKVKFNVSKGMDTSLDVSGYAEMIKTDSGWRFSEGCLTFNAEFKYTYQGQVFIWVVPCYYEFGGGVGAELEGKMININPETFTPEFEAYLTAKIMAEIGGGIGVAKVATLGASGEGSLNIKSGIGKDYLKAWGEGEASFKVKVFGKTVAQKKIAQGDFLIYETGSNKGLIKDDAISLQSIEQHSLMSSIDSEKVYENESRDYLEQPTLWLTTYPIQGYGAAEYTNKNLAKIADNIYTEAAPQICEIEGKKVMVLQWDNPKRADIDRTMLVYSVYNDSTKQWSEVKAVDDDGTADFYPCFRDGYLVWQNETSKLSDTMTLEKIGALGEICVAKWNGNGFDAPKTLTNNTVLDTQPVICATKTGASAVWSVNSESDIMGVTGENTLMQADFNGSAWTTPKAIKSDLTAVTNLNAGILDGQFTVAYVTDDDNDLGTVDDRDIRLISGFSERQLTNNEVLDSNPVFENNLLYYYSEGNIQSCAADGSKLQSVFSEAKPGLHDRFVMDSNNQGDTAIWWEKTVEKGTEIYTCLLQDGVWSDEIQVTELENQAKYPSGLLNENGSMDVVFNNGIVKDGEITKTDLYMISVIPSYDLALSDVTVDEETMTVYGSVKNSGELTVNAYTVKIEGNTEQKITEPLLPGQSAEFTIVYKKPSNFTPQNIKVTVSQQEGEEYDTKNNQVSLFVGNADVAVEHVSANDSVITADISNIGYQTASDVTVQLKDGQQVLEERVLHLSAGQTEQVSFTVERKDMLFLENTKQLYVTASCDQTEISLGNNDGYAYITSLSGEADYYSKILNYSQVDGKWIVNSVAGNHTGEDVACIIYSSVYDKEGKLKGTGMKKATIEAQNDTGVDIALSCTIQSGDVIKTFLWQDMMPLTEADTFAVE
ncbi:MAG: leucine-rich repeat domain-containing protein [Ruminococcaceae bacterium]|nr:leucine-rich repeat domain-containing protein [Oscillospiraceae bacterium]